VLQQLRDAIVRQELTPGQAVGIEQLAGLLGVSRTPVREALPALHQLGLLEVSPAGGFQVASLDATYVWQVYAVRSALESLAASAIAAQLTDEDLMELRSVALPEQVEPTGDYSEMFGPDVGLHDFVRRKCSLGFLNVLMDTVQVHRNRLLELEHSASTTYRKQSYAEHEAIVSALERRDAGLVRRLMQEHLDRVGGEVARLAAERDGTTS
jgi:DNA-binding GntR family transcriptional regulator